MIHKKTVAVTLIALLLFFSTEAYALQNQEASSEYKLNKQFLGSFVHDFNQVVSAPKDWNKTDLVKLSAFVASGTLIFIFDEDIYSWVQKRKSPTSDDIFRFSNSLGHGIFLGSSITALYITGEIFDDVRLRQIALLGLESWIITGVIVAGMKFMIGRARPCQEETSTTFHPFSFSTRYRSFPSGHASSAFALATTIADHSDKFIVDALAYSLAVLAGIARVHEEKHWASDVFIGAVLGHFISKKISAWHKREKTQRIQVGFHCLPQKQSFTLSFRF